MSVEVFIGPILRFRVLRRQPRQFRRPAGHLQSHVRRLGAIGTHETTNGHAKKQQNDPIGARPTILALVLTCPLQSARGGYAGQPVPAQRLTMATYGPTRTRMLYFHDMRYFSAESLRFNDTPPVSLLADASQGHVAVFELTNPDLKGHLGDVACARKGSAFAAKSALETTTRRLSPSTTT